MHILVLILGALGHVILWVALVNRLHALGINRRWIDMMTGTCGLAVAALPLAVAAVLYRDWVSRPVASPTVTSLSWSYVVGCAVVAVVGMIQRWRIMRHPERHGAVIANHTTHIKLRDEADGPLAAPGISSWMTRLPFNQALDISVHEKQLILPRLSVRQGELRIAHLSDLHMSGR